MEGNYINVNCSNHYRILTEDRKSCHRTASLISCGRCVDFLSKKEQFFFALEKKQKLKP